MRIVPQTRTGKICMVCIVLLMFSTGLLTLEQYVHSAQSEVVQAETAQEDSLMQSQQVNMGTLLLRTVLSLVAVITLLYIGVFFLKKFVLHKNGSGRANTSLRVMDSTFLGPKKAVYLVEVVDRILILGVTDSQVSLLSEITDQETLKNIHLAGSSAVKGIGSSFSDHLSSLLKGMKKDDR